MEDRPSGSFTTSISPDKNAVRLNLNGQSIEMTTSQLARLIEHLGEVRATLQPPVPATPDPRQRSFPLLEEFVVATMDDQPAVECGARFSFRSQYYGWQVIRMSPACCRVLGENLLGIERPSPFLMPESGSMN